MKLTRRRVEVSAGVFACLFPLAAIGQTTATCKGPDEMERAAASYPSAGVYDALGAYFANHKQTACAISSFEKAIRLDPSSWEGHYNLGITLLTNNNPQRAIRELQSAANLKAGSVKILIALGAAQSQVGQQSAAIETFREVLKQSQNVQAIDGLAKALIAEKRYTAAIAELKSAPADDELRLELAIAYLKNGNTDEALMILSQIVGEHPDNAEAHNNLGLVYAQEKRFDEAAKQFDAALLLDPSDDSVRLSEVKALVAVLQYDKAEPLSDTYLKRHLHEFEAWYFNGIVKRGLGNFSEAEKDFEQAVVLNPNHAEARSNLGFVLAKLGRYSEARVQLDKALQLNPDASEARFQLATVLRALRQQDEAHKTLNVLEEKKAESVKQDVAGMSASQASENLTSGYAEKAVELYKSSLQNDPKNPRIYYDLALALHRLSRFTEERQALEKAQELDPKLAQVHNQLGFLDMQDGHAQSAETQFKTAISLDPQYAEAQNNLGVLYGQLGQSAEAEKMFRLATENNPQYGQAFANLGLILAGGGHFADGEKALATAVQLDPQNVRALTVYAMVLTRLNRAKKAVPLFRRVVEIMPQSADAHLNLGIALADQFNLRTAMEEFSKAAQLDPKNAAAHYNKGRALLDQQQYQEAKPALETSVKLDPTNGDAWYLLGLILRQEDATNEAVHAFQQSIADRPDYAEAHFMLAQELNRKGDTADAVEQWKKALEIRPRYSEALYNLARVLMKSNPEEAKLYQVKFEQLQTDQHITDRASMLGNFALVSADAHDWPQAIAQMKEALDVCKECSALATLHKDLGLIYCRAGDFARGRRELLEAKKLTPSDGDIAQALHSLDMSEGPQ